jgi:hypothetical protein
MREGSIIPVGSMDKQDSNVQAMYLSRESSLLRHVESTYTENKRSKYVTNYVKPNHYPTCTCLPA